MKLDTFKKGVAALTLQFPEKQIDARVVWPFIKDLTDEQYLKAISSILKEIDEIKKSTNIIALIRRYALVGQKKLACEAWTEVISEVRRVGSYGSPKFSDEIIKKAVEAIGWRNICLSEMPSVDRAHFLKVYDQLVSREISDKVLGENLIDENVKKLLPDKGVDV